MAYWAVIFGLSGSLALGAALTPPVWLHLLALFVHLASIIIGLGAVVLLEFMGVLWIRRRAELGDLRRIERPVTTFAWLGIAGLLGSGVFLHPNLGDPLTIVKMGAVLVVAMNGVALTRLTAELGRLPARTPFTALPPSIKLWCAWSAVVSQAAWWTAVWVGMLNTAGR